MIRSFALSILLLFATGTGGVATPPSQAETAPAAVSPGDRSLSPLKRNGRQAPSLWQDSIQAIKQGGWDLGGWLAYRRALLVQASVRNRYFWFCISSFALNAVLLYLFYASRLGEDRKLWKATAAMTDLWNWALYADAMARHAIHKFNEHVERCNRLADLEASGKSPLTERNEELGQMKAEMEALRHEKAVLQEQLSEREQAVGNLHARVDEIARQAGIGFPADSKLKAQLMEKVNMLTSRNQQLERQLDDATQKLARFTREGVV